MTKIEEVVFVELAKRDSHKPEELAFVQLFQTGASSHHNFGGRLLLERD